ncbi:MAG TPA: outer membrane beta-barrel protein [Xanthobacteraceae bacterium]|nr:outer membrane beta-barrel protein [Xanthobacteraceae bacterium]
MKPMIRTVTLLGGLAALSLAGAGAANAGLLDPEPAYPPATFQLPASPGAPPAYPPGAAPSGAPPGYPETIYSRFSKPTHDWTGFYVGVNGGANWSSASWISPQDAASGTSGTVTAAMVGGTMGYNAQTIGAWVYGVEFDFDWRQSASIVIPPASCAPNCLLDRSWFATARVRFGYTFGNVMPFVTGGVALTDERISIAGQPFGLQNDIGVGLVGGVGVEVAVAGPVSAKLEYLYARYNSITCNDACGAGPNFAVGALQVTPSENIVRAGVNVRLWDR